MNTDRAIVKLAISRLAERTGLDDGAYLTDLILREAERKLPDWWIIKVGLSAEAIETAAYQMARGENAVGFTLDELIDYLGLEAISSPTRKGHIAQVLRDVGLEHRLRTVATGRKAWLWVVK